MTLQRRGLLKFFQRDGFHTCKHATGCETSSSAIAERPRDAHELLRFAKLRSGIFEPPFWGLRGNVDASCVRRWKKRGRLPIGDK